MAAMVRAEKLRTRPTEATGGGRGDRGIELTGPDAFGDVG
jgi:hypothetical protein